MENYSSDIEKLSRELSRALKSGIDIVAHEEIFSWVDSVLFNNNYIQQNHAVNLLWIFSKQRILKDNKKIQGTCSWLYKNLKQPLHNREYEIVAAYIIVVIESLTSTLNELPSVRSCLSNAERENVKDKITEIIADDRILNFESSSQHEQLTKLKSIPIVSSFLNNYVKLLDFATDQEEDTKNIQSIMQYILTVDDVVKDSFGVLGLVDDLYAMQQLNLDLSDDDADSIKWKFEIDFPDFQFPIIIDREGNNLINKLDGLIKIALFNNSETLTSPKVFFLDEPGPFSILVSLLGCITNIELNRENKPLQNIEVLQKAKTYKFSYGLNEINLVFNDIFKDVYLLGGFHQIHGKWSGSLESDEVNKCNIEITDEEPASLTSHFDKFKNSLSKKIHGMFPFGMANNLKMSLEKVFIVDKKKNLDIYLQTEIEGRTIEEWFGRRIINTRGKETVYRGLLSSEPLITTAFNLDSVLLYIYENDDADDKFHSLNLISSGSIDNDIEQLSRLASKFNQCFKTLNVFSDQYNDYVEELFKDAGYKIFRENRDLANIYVQPPKDSLFENYLSKVGAYPKIELIAVEEPRLEAFFQIANFQLGSQYIILKNLLFSIKRILLSRYSKLSSTAKDQLKIKLNDFIARLRSYVHVHENIEKMILFLEENQEFMLEFERSTFVYESFKDSSDTKILVSGKEFESLRKKNWEKNHLTKTDLKQLNQTKALIVPAFIDRKIIKNLINFPFAEEIIFIASKYEIDNYLSHLVEDRFHIPNKDEISTSNEDIDKFEKTFIDIDLDSISSSASRSDDYSGQIYESRLFLLDNNTCLNLPKNGNQIITHDLINLLPEEVAVKSIDPGDYLIIPDTQNASLQDSILNLIVENIDEIRNKASMWKHMLADALNSRSISLEELQEALKASGEKRHLQTIHNWFRNPQLIAPQHPEKLFLTFTQILKLEPDALNECLANTKILYRERNKVMDNLAEYLKDAAYDELTNTLELKIENKKFTAHIYEALTFQDTCVTFDELYKVKGLEDHFDRS